MIGLIAANHQQGYYEISKRGLDTSQVFVITPRSLDRARGHRLDDVIYADNWWVGCTVEQAIHLDWVIRPTLVS